MNIGNMSCFLQATPIQFATRKTMYLHQLAHEHIEN